MNKKVSRALVSVSDKTGIVEFCRSLQQLGIEYCPQGVRKNFERKSYSGDRSFGLHGIS